MTTYEIELKIKLLDNDKARIDEYLSSNKFSGKFEGGFEQTDNYFDTTEPSFARNDTALRVRVEKPTNASQGEESTIEMTYKGKKLNPNSKTRLEYNLNLTKETKYESVEGFLNELGYIKSVSINKQRLNYSLENDITLSIDTNEIGTFVEIEKIIDDKSLIESTEVYLWDYLQKIIGKLPIDRKIVKSYLELILESRISE